MEERIRPPAESSSMHRPTKESAAPHVATWTSSNREETFECVLQLLLKGIKSSGSKSEVMESFEVCKGRGGRYASTSR